MVGATLLRALRVRGPMTIAQCRATLKNASDSLGPEALSLCVKHKNEIWLKIERALLQSLPIHLSKLTKDERVFYSEQVDRLPIKRGPNNLLMAATRLNSTSSQSMLNALYNRPQGWPTTELSMEYPGAQNDIISLHQQGHLIVIGGRAWAVFAPAMIEGAAHLWQCSLETHQ